MSILMEKCQYWMRFKMIYDAFNRAHELEISFSLLFKGAIMSRERIWRVWETWYDLKPSLTKRALRKMWKHQNGLKMHDFHHFWCKMSKFPKIGIVKYHFKRAQYRIFVLQGHATVAKSALNVYHRILIPFKSMMRLDQKVGRGSN